MTAKTLHTVWAAVIVLALAFIFVRSGLDFDYVIPKRLERLATMVIGGICVAWSSIAFQSLTGNRILTPAIMGYESIYLLFQALLMLMLGTRSLVVLGEHGNVILSMLLMLGYSWVLHRWLFRDGRDNVYFLLLVGLVLTMVITTLTQFIQLKMSPANFPFCWGTAKPLSAKPALHNCSTLPPSWSRSVWWATRPFRCSTCCC